MHANLPIAIPMFGFLAALTRVSGAVVFIPIPGTRSGPDAARVVLSLGITMALYPVWPALSPESLTPGRLALLVISEAAFGITAGLAVAFLLEGFVLAAQVLGLQAGFSYSSTIDPSSQADSTVLQVFVQLVSSLLFFVLGIHHHVIRASLETIAPGAFPINGGVVDIVLKLGSGMFLLGLRLALPVIALLLLVDVVLALTGRVNAQLQLLNLAFPAKMLAGLLLLAEINMRRNQREAARPLLSLGIQMAKAINSHFSLTHAQSLQHQLDAELGLAR